MGDLAKLTTFNVNGNRLRGSLPTHLGRLVGLKEMHLSAQGHGRGGSHALTSSIPSEFGRLTDMSALSAYGNALDGTIPSQIGQLYRLRNLHLHSNGLSGTLPRQLGELPLIVLYLQGNKLTGAVPEELCDIHSLQSCHLEGNQFTSVPPCVAERCVVKNHWGNASKSRERQVKRRKDEAGEAAVASEEEAGEAHEG